MNQDDPKTWKVGDVLKCVHLRNLPRLVVGNLYTIQSIEHPYFFFKELPSTFAVRPESFVFVRRANAEGSGECQSRSHMPDSAGATPAPSTKCECFASIDGGVHEKDCPFRPAPVIEQKPVCMCCTKFHFPQDVGEEIFHDDPCKFTHLERYMLPIAKAQFRERQEQLEIERSEREHLAEDAQLLKNVESWMGRNPHMRGEHPNVLNYARLTGHNFKDD